MQTILKKAFQVIISLILVFLLPYGASFIHHELVFPVFCWTLVSLAIFDSSDESTPKRILSKVLMSLSLLISSAYLYLGMHYVEGKTLFWQAIVFPGVIFVFWYFTIIIIKKIENEDACVAMKLTQVNESENCEADCQCADCLEAYDVEDLEDSLDFIRSKDLYAEFRAYQDQREEERKNRNSW